MKFHSILYRHAGDRPPIDTLESPPFFIDLNLDQVLDAIVSGREEYDLKPFLRAPLNGPEAVGYRQEVMRDVRKERIAEAIAMFARSMRTVRAELHTVEKLYYVHEKERHFVDGARIYCEAVIRLTDDLAGDDVESTGLSAFGAYLAAYLQSESFKTLHDDVKELLSNLANVEYLVLVNGSSITVRNYSGESDYVTSIQDTFSRFKQGSAKEYLVAFPERIGMNHVEAKVLEFVALLYPGVFSELDRFYRLHATFIDSTIHQFDREAQLYLAYAEYVQIFERAGLQTCYPQVSSETKDVIGEDCFDFALAQKLIATGTPVVCNDFHLSGPERVFVVSGPNQGGKTTFARTFGQMQYLASLGFPVAGRRARTFLFDAMFSHFERQEDPGSLRGKLEDDLIRLHDILARATSASIIIINEIFTSTTARDAGVLGRKIMAQILRLDGLCVFVTFIDELASLSEKTVSMVSLVDPRNPDVRTYKLERKPADGLAYAVSLAEKYGLTYRRLKERLSGAGPG